MFDVLRLIILLSSWAWVLIKVEGDFILYIKNWKRKSIELKFSFQPEL